MVSFVLIGSLLGRSKWGQFLLEEEFWFVVVVVVVVVVAILHMSMHSTQHSLPD